MGITRKMSDIRCRKCVGKTVTENIFTTLNNFPQQLYSKKYYEEIRITITFCRLVIDLKDSNLTNVLLIGDIKRSQFDQHFAHWCF